MGPTSPEAIAKKAELYRVSGFEVRSIEFLYFFEIWGKYQEKNLIGLLSDQWTPFLLKQIIFWEQLPDEQCVDVNRETVADKLTFRICGCREKARTLNLTLVYTHARTREPSEQFSFNLSPQTQLNFSVRQVSSTCFFISNLRLP